MTDDSSELAQVKPSEPTEITKVEVQQTAEGLTLELVTGGELSVSETVITENTAIAEISNAVLRLAEGEDFFAIDPVEGITFISVTPLANNRVEIAITGTDAPPDVDIRVGVAGIRVSATPKNPTASGVSRGD